MTHPFFLLQKIVLHLSSPYDRSLLWITDRARCVVFYHPGTWMSCFIKASLVATFLGLLTPQQQQFFSASRRTTRTHSPEPDTVGLHSDCKSKHATCYTRALLVALEFLSSWCTIKLKLSLHPRYKLNKSILPTKLSHIIKQGKKWRTHTNNLSLPSLAKESIRKHGLSLNPPTSARSQVDETHLVERVIYGCKIIYSPLRFSPYSRTLVEWNGVEQASKNTPRPRIGRESEWVVDASPPRGLWVIQVFHVPRHWPNDGHFCASASIHPLDGFVTAGW